MVLEATVVCVDNSDWMRNGDYTPTRLEAQQDAVNLICGAKTQSNAESAVAVVACGGKSPEVIVSLTSDIGKILSSLHSVKISGNLQFLAGLQVAQLVLKHRQNKNQHQRIVFFVGSPISVEQEELVQLAKRLKKNNIAIDIVNFGEEATNTEKLEAFIANVNNNDNSHLVTIPPGPHILSDILISSPIITGDSGGTGAAGPVSGGSDFGFVDPNLDPELALALKVSMEEERARQAQASKQTEGTQETSTGTSKEVEMIDANDEESLLLQEALKMSMQAAPATSTPTNTNATTNNTNNQAPQVTQDVDMDDLSEDQQMMLAMQMSMNQAATQTPTPTSTSNTGSSEVNKVMEDPNFVNSVLMSLPGVDPNDERIKSVLEGLLSQDKDKEKKDEKDKK